MCRSPGRHIDYLGSETDAGGSSAVDAKCRGGLGVALAVTPPAALEVLHLEQVDAFEEHSADVQATLHELRIVLGVVAKAAELVDFGQGRPPGDVWSLLGAIGDGPFTGNVRQMRRARQEATARAGTLASAARQEADRLIRAARAAGAEAAIGPVEEADVAPSATGRSLTVADESAFVAAAARGPDGLTSDARGMWAGRPAKFLVPLVGIVGSVALLVGVRSRRSRR